MIIVTVTGPSMAEALRQIRHVGRDADMIELRLDLVRCTDLHSLFSSARRPVIATCRPPREGGGFAGSERTRSEILRVALGLRARMVDLELSAGERFFGAVMEGRSREGMIVSRHFMTPGVPDTRAVYREMRRAGAGCLKLRRAPLSSLGFSGSPGVRLIVLSPVRPLRSSTALVPS